MHNEDIGIRNIACCTDAQYDANADAIKSCCAEDAEYCAYTKSCCMFSIYLSVMNPRALIKDWKYL